MTTKLDRLYAQLGSEIPLQDSAEALESFVAGMRWTLAKVYARDDDPEWRFSDEPHEVAQR